MLFETLIPLWMSWPLHVLKIVEFRPFKKTTSDPGPA
jgi:hypothetical protein